MAFWSNWSMFISIKGLNEFLTHIRMCDDWCWRKLKWKQSPVTHQGQKCLKMFMKLCKNVPSDKILNRLETRSYFIKANVHHVSSKKILTTLNFTSIIFISQFCILWFFKLSMNLGIERRWPGQMENQVTRCKTINEFRNQSTEGSESVKLFTWLVLAGTITTDHQRLSKFKVFVGSPVNCPVRFYYHSLL